MNKIKLKFLMLALAGSLVNSGCLDSGGGGGGGLGDGHDFGSNNPNLVIAVGDSLTVGGYSGGLSWPSRLDQMIEQSVMNKGVAGATSTIARDGIASLLFETRPGFVVVMIGANDAIKLVDPADTRANIEAIIVACKANKSIPVLVNVMTMNGPREVFNTFIPGINESIRVVAQEQKVKLVDLFKAAGTDTAKYQIDDGLHLNDAGETFVAMEISDVF
jgi:acyl-CoA thioesterase-1